MDYTIVLDAGHGGNDPGAVYQGRREKDDNLRLALAVGDILEQSGVNVIYTRREDVYQTPFEKATIGNNTGADFFISFHRNSSATPGQYNGVETLVYDKSGIKYEMAENIDGALAELGFRNLGVKERPGLVVLRRTQMPSLLIEAGFLNDSGDNRIFDEQFDEIARAIASAILGTLDMESVDDSMSGSDVSNMNTGVNSDRALDMDTRVNLDRALDMDTRVNSTSASNEDASIDTDTGVAQMQGARPNMDAGIRMQFRPNMGMGEEQGSRPNWGMNQAETLYRVQVGAFKNKEYADNLVYELDDKGFPAYVLYEDGFYKVQVGAYRQLGNAIKQEQNLRQAGFNTWITT